VETIVAEIIIVADSIDEPAAVVLLQVDLLATIIIVLDRLDSVTNVPEVAVRQFVNHDSIMIPMNSNDLEPIIILVTIHRQQPMAMACIPIDRIQNLHRTECHHLQQIIHTAVVLVVSIKFQIILRRRRHHRQTCTRQHIKCMLKYHRHHCHHLAQHHLNFNDSIVFTKSTIFFFLFSFTCSRSYYIYSALFFLFVVFSCVTLLSMFKWTKNDQYI